MRWRAVLFDLDDTLIDRAGAYRRWAYEFVASRPRVFPAPIEAQRILLELDRDGDGTRERRDYCSCVVAAFPALELTADALWEVFSNTFPAYVLPEPAIARLVDEVAAKHRVCVVSNGSARMQRAKLVRAGLDSRFPRLFVSGELGVAKPDRAIFAQALAWAGCRPDEALFVGDDPLRDIDGGARAGLATAWVSHGRTFPPGRIAPRFVLERVTDLLGILE